MTIAERLNSTPGFIGPTTLAKLINAHPQTIYGWCREGLIPHCRVGARIKFDPTLIATWLEKRAIGK